MIGLLVFLGYVCMPIAQSMDSQMTEDRDIKLRVLKEDHSQALWNYLIDQSNKLDRKRALPAPYTDKSALLIQHFQQ